MPQIHILSRAQGRLTETILAYTLRNLLGHDLTREVVLVSSLSWQRAVERRLAVALPEDNRPRVVYRQPGLRGLEATTVAVDDLEVTYAD